MTQDENIYCENEHHRENYYLLQLDFERYVELLFPV